MRNFVSTIVLALVIAIIEVFTAGGAFAESNPNWHFKLTGADGTLTANVPYTVEVYFIPDYFPAPGQPNDGPNTLRVYSLDVGFDTNNLDFLSIAYYTHDLGSGATWQGGTLRPYNTINGTIQYVNGTVYPRSLTNVYWPDEDNHHLATITFNAKSTGTFQNQVWWEDPAADRYAIVDGIAYTSDPLILWKEDGVPVGTRDQNGTYEPYVLHLGVSETPPLDTFPQETTPAGMPYYTAVASARQALRFLSGDGYTWPDLDTLYETYHLGLPTEDMSPQDLTTMLNALTYYDTQSLWYRVYHFGVNSDTDEDMAIKRLIHWIDYRVPGVPDPPTPGYPPQLNAPAHVPMYGGYNWVTVRGFQSDFAPTADGSVWTIPQNLTVYGLWLNDPKSTGIGYNVYMTGDTFKSNYYLIGGTYLSVAEPPVLEAEQELEQHLDEITIGYVRGRPNAELAGTFQERLDLRLSILKGDLASELTQKDLLRKTEAVEDQLNGIDWSAIVPTELLSAPDFSASFKGSGYHKALRVANLDTAQDYELLLFGKAASGDSASAVLLMDAADGSFKQASWTTEDQAYLSESQALRIAANALGATFPIRHQELEAWNKRSLARNRLFTTVEPVLSSRLIWAEEFEQSVFRPVYEIPTPFGPTVYVMQDGTHTLKGEVNPEFLGGEPGTAGPEESLSGSAVQVPSLTSAQALKRFEDQALAALPLLSVAAFAPENGTGTDRVQQAEIWLRINTESMDNAALIMARAADLYREVTGTVGPVTVTRWQGSTRLESLEF